MVPSYVENFNLIRLTVLELLPL